MRAFRVGVVAALLAAAFAVPASATPSYSVSGRVLDDAGRPVRGAVVTFEVPPDSSFFGLLGCAFVFFVSPTCWSHTVSARTDARGHYALRFSRDSYVASEGRHYLTASETGTVTLPGAWTRATFDWSRESAMPDLHLWHGAVSATAYGPVRHVHSDALPASFGSDRSEPVVVLTQKGAQVWQYLRTTTERVADGRTVEDGVDAVRAWATATYDGEYAMLYVTPAHAVSGGVRPVSRGASCATYGRGDAVLPLPRCLFTDGRLAERISIDYLWQRGRGCLSASTTCPHGEWVRLDLGSLQPIEAVTVRGCALETLTTDAHAETSLDGVTWTAFRGAAVPGEPFVYGPPTVARYVRVDLDPCTFGATEVSVF